MSRWPSRVLATLATVAALGAGCGSTAGRNGAARPDGQPPESRRSEPLLVSAATVDVDGTAWILGARDGRLRLRQLVLGVNRTHDTP